MLRSKRILSFIMALVMTLSLLPAQVVATQQDTGVSSDEVAAIAAVPTTTEILDFEGLDNKVSITYRSDAEIYSDSTAKTWEYNFDNSGSSTVSDTITISNTGDQRLNFSYSYVSDTGEGSITVDGSLAAAANSCEVAPGSSLNIGLTIPKGDYPQLRLSGFEFKESMDSDVQFIYDKNLGSVSVDDAEWVSGNSKHFDAGDKVRLKAIPATGVSFLGWVTNTGYVLSTSLEYEFEASGETSVKAAFATANAKAWFYTDGKTYLFDDLNLASDHAASSDKTVVLAASGMLESGDYTVDSGVTLLIPFNDGHKVDTDTEPTLTGREGNVFTQEPISASVAFRTLTLKSGAVLEVAGALNVNSGVFAIGVRDTGNPHGPYGLMVLENGSEVKVVSGGTLYCYGYIIGTYDKQGDYSGGKVTAESAANVYELFQIRDMRGSRALLAGNTLKMFPMTQYYVQNIEAQYEILPGAFSNAVMSVASEDSLGMFASIAFVGDKDSGLFRLTDGKLSRLYQPTKDRIVYTLKNTESGSGAMSLDKLVIEHDMMDIDSSEYVLGIAGSISVNLEPGSAASINQKVKLLPGAEINVAENATLTVTSGKGALVLYDDEDWETSFVMYPTENNTAITGNVTLNPNNAGTKKNVVRYSPSRAQVKGAITSVVHGSAILHVDGTLVANGNVYSTYGWKTSERGSSIVVPSDADNVIAGTGTFTNSGAYGSMEVKEYYNNTSANIFGWVSDPYAIVSTQPLRATVVSGSTISDRFTDTTGTVVYRGYYHETNMNGMAEPTDYIWSADVLTTKPVHLMCDGKELKSWETTVYPGMDYSGYFSDPACKNAANADSPELYVPIAGQACIINSAGVVAYDTLKEAMAAAKAGDTVKLLKDVVYSGAGLVVNKTTLDVTLDLNNHSITADSYTILNRGRISIYGGDLKDAEGNDLAPGKLISNGGQTHSSALYTQIYDSGEYFVGDITSIGGNLSLELKGTGLAAVYNSGAYIGQFGTAGSKITVTSPGLLLHLTSGATIDALGGAGSYVEMTQTTGQNKNIRAVYNQGTIGTIGDTNAEVRITQNYEYTGGGNPELLTNAGTINVIGGTGATVLLNQYRASGIGFALRVDSGVVGKIGGDDTKRVEIVSSHIPVYVAKAGTIEEISTNTLFVAKIQFASQAAIWKVGTIEKINGGWFNSATNTVDAIFRTGDNKPGGEYADALTCIESGYGLSDKTVSIDSLAMETPYTCYPVLPVSEIDAEARNGNAYYTSLKTAVDKAKAGDTVTMLKDIARQLFVDTITQNVTLDMNNHSITSTGYALLNRGKISIYGGDLEDANGNPLEPGKLISAGTNASLSSCIYNQRYEGTTKEYDAHIYSIGGNLALIDQTGAGKGAIYNHGAHIGEIGTAGSKITITGPKYLINMDSEATLDTLGGAGSHVKLVQNGTAEIPAINFGGTITNIGYGEGSLVEIESVSKSIYVASGATLGTLGGENSTVVITQNASGAVSPWLMDVVGTVNHIGGKNAMVKLIQNSAGTLNNGNGAIIRTSGGTVSNIGTQEGSKVLMNQTMLLSGDCGWGLDVRSGKIGTIGSENSLVEVIADHCPVYLGGAINLITGNTLMVGKRDYNDSKAFWMATGKTVDSITGGYFAQDGVAVDDSYVDYIFDDNNQAKIIGTADAPTGYAICEETVERYSEMTKEPYDCLYVYKVHEHVPAVEPTLEWATKNGKVILTAVAPCGVANCPVLLTGEAVAQVSAVTEGNVWKATYTATVTLGGEEYTRTKTDELPYGGTKTMKYDDRLTSDDIRVLDAGKPTSRKVYSGGLDDAVVTAYGDKLVATGIGTAQAVIDGKVYDITVEKAVIDLFMITGHSVGMGSQGNTHESVLIDDGSAYSFTVTNTDLGPTSYRYIDLIPTAENIGLGYAAGENRPPEVDNFTSEGGGVIGEDSGLAWKWNKLTGHKVYVINSAVGSTSMYHWYIDKSNSADPVPILSNAIQNFTYARRIIQNEVDAGHFEMGDMTLITHTAANYSNTWGAIQMLYNDVDGKVWFEKVLGDIATAMEIDWDNDGTVEEGTETMRIGFVPIWTRAKDPDKDTNPDNDNDPIATYGSVNFGADKPLTAFLGTSSAYADIFMASLIGRNEWSDDNKVNAYFTVKEQEYLENHPYDIQSGESFTFPKTNRGLYPDDCVHYLQVAYNYMGMDVAENTYKLVYDTFDDNDVSLKLYKTDGKTEIAADGEETLDLTNGKKLTLVPVADPVSVNDFVFEAEGSMAIEYPLTLYGNGYGEGTLTISYKGKVLKTIKIDMGDAVARVGDKEYGDLQTAINAAPAAGVVELLKDIELDATITVAEGMNVTLDLSNYTVTSSATPVIQNKGTLSIDGGELGQDAGALVHTGTGWVVYNHGTMSTIGGNLLLKAATGNGVYALSGTIDTIGGTNGDVTIEANRYTVFVDPSATINNIGASTDGDGGKVTITQDNGGSSTIQYPFYVKGTVNSIGGTNADVTIKQTNRIKNFSATVFVTTATGKIKSIGGEGATVNIIQNDQAGNPKNFQIAIWMNGGYIDTLGSGGTVNIVSNNTGVYFGGSTTSDVYINTIGAAGTVNFTGPVVDGKETSCKYGIRVNSSKHDKDIGVLGAGAEVNINASTYGVYVEKANSDIDRIATAGTVNINSENIGIYLETAGAKINTIGAGGTVNIEATSNAIKTNAAVTIDTIGKSGTVIIKSKAEAILVDGGGRINTIGGVNADVTIDNTIGSNMNTIYIQNGSIGSIGSTGTGLVTIHAAQRGILIMSSTVDATKPTVESIGGPGGRVEINAGLKDTKYNACIYVASSNTLGTLGGENSQVIVYQKSKTSGDGAIYVGSGSTINNLGEGLIVATMTAGNYAVNAPGTIGLVSGGLYACDGRDKVFSKGANSQTYPAGYTLSNSTVSVTLPDRNVRECYYIVEKTAGTGTGAETPAPIGGFADAVAAYFAMADNSNSFVILTEDCTETADITLNGDLYLDLNGCELDISGIEFDLNGYDLYVIDSGTNGYLQSAQDVVGSIVGEIENGKQTGEVVTVYTVDRGANEGKTYVQINGNDGREFHRAAFSVTGIQFAFDSAANAGSGKGYLTFRGTLRGDEDVLESLDALGFSINDAAASDVDWKEVTGAHGLHAYYTTSLASADAVSTVAGMMDFGGEYAPGSQSQVIPLLKGIKGKLAESDLSDEQKELLEAYFSALE